MKGRACATVAGCGSCPALTSDAWMVPSARSVDPTASPLSAAAKPTASSSVVIGSPFTERRSKHVATSRHCVHVAICAEGLGAGHHALHAVAQVVVIGGTEECVQIGYRLER